MVCRFLQLDGMTLSEIRQVEEHYLRAGKWPWNKILNGYVRTHPEWLNRMLKGDVLMLAHMSNYEQDTRRKQGLARFGLHQEDPGLKSQAVDLEQDLNLDEDEDVVDASDSEVTSDDEYDCDDMYGPDEA